MFMVFAFVPIISLTVWNFIKKADEQPHLLFVMLFSAFCKMLGKNFYIQKSKIFGD